MSKGKLTVQTPDLVNFKTACELSGIKVLQVAIISSSLNKVEINYKTEQQIWDASGYFKTLSTENKIENLNEKENVKENSKKSRTKKS